MRPLLLAALAVLAAAAPAQASHPAEPVTRVIDEIQVYCTNCPPSPPYLVPYLVERVESVKDAIALNPDFVDPQVKATQTWHLAVAAYGEGTTTCTLTFEKSSRSFYGGTSCDRALSQTAQASVSGGTSASGPLCSGVRTSCSSGGTTTGDYTTLRYDVTLVAPAGQGWVAPPNECSGAGTDRLQCTFLF